MMADATSGDNVVGVGESFQVQELGKCINSFIDTGSIESHRYYLSRRTVLEMLRDRGYSIPNSDIDLTLEQFRVTYGENPDAERLKITAFHKSDHSKKMLVIFCGLEVIKVPTIRVVLGQINSKESLSGVMLILQDKISKQAIAAANLFSFKVEMFQITDLLSNITKHVLKPKHQVLSEAEKQKLLKEYSIEEKQLPRMLADDAIARYYALEKGQVVKINYAGGVTDSYQTYRCIW